VAKAFRFLFLKCSISHKYTFHVHVTAQASSGNVIVLSQFIMVLSWDISCHCLVWEESIYV